MIDLPREFAERMKVQLGENYSYFLKSYELPPQKAIRVNTLKISVDNFIKISPFALTPIPWEPSGFYVEGEGIGKTVLHAAGGYYVQEPSAMSVVPELEVKPGERVLDLCSAPGGKGTQIAQYMSGDGVLVLNEPDRRRCDILAQNVERMGVKNATVTCAPPELLSSVFENYFDKILVDAPCSGEGMFKKEPNAIPEWSLQNVKMCAQRQEHILAEADKMLCGGGRLVYSTCTFAPEEDEEQINCFLSSHHDYKLIKMKKLYPHEVRGEGHFFAVLQKGEGGRAENFPPIKPHLPPKAEQIYREWERATLHCHLENLILSGDLLFTFQNSGDFTSHLSEKDKRLFRQTVCIGKLDLKKSVPFTPMHGLAAILSKDDANSIEVNEKTALNYLRGLTFDCPENLKGWKLVTYNNLPLGWCKTVNGIAKNHLPKGLRI